MAGVATGASAGARAGAGGLGRGKEEKEEGYIHKVMVYRNSTVDLSVVRR